MADDGIARAVSPAHTPGDSDTLFVLGTARLAIERSATRTRGDADRHGGRERGLARDRARAAGGEVDLVPAELLR